MRILVVRLSALGDMVHALPAVAALRRAFPAARIDWLVDERYRELVELVPVVDHRITLPRVHRVSGAPRVVRALRAARYDVALDLQGLLKSGLLARGSGARRVIGFDRAHRRERAAGWLYTETPPLGAPVHVIERNLALAASLDAPPRPFEFPLADRPSDAVGRTRAVLGIDRGRPFVLVSPGAAWRSKRWAPERFGTLAQRLRAARGLRTAVLWGPGERALAERVAAASAGAAAPAPATSVADLVALARAAALVVAGDTGPLHVAAAVGAPVVGIYGPSDPRRNGPWSPRDVVVSRCHQCRCRQDRAGTTGVVVRRCAQAQPCIASIAVDEVAQAAAGRLAAADEPAAGFPP